MTSTLEKARRRALGLVVASVAAAGSARAAEMIPPGLCATRAEGVWRYVDYEFGDAPAAIGNAEAKRILGRTIHVTPHEVRSHSGRCKIRRAIVERIPADEMRMLEVDPHYPYALSFECVDGATAPMFVMGRSCSIALTPGEGLMFTLRKISARKRR